MTKCNMQKCFQGWSEEDGNHAGRCCCNCKHQRAITGHPWNVTPAIKTPVTKIIGWGCMTPELPTITLFEFEHSCCEVWEEKNA